MGSLRVDRDGHVLRVTLARPERRNAFDAALIAEVTEFDETRGSAVVSVKTQRQQMGAVAGGESVYYQDLVLDFIRIKDVWRVNAARWANQSGG